MPVMAELLNIQCDLENFQKLAEQAQTNGMTWDVLRSAGICIGYTHYNKHQ